MALRTLRLGLPAGGEWVIPMERPIAGGEETGAVLSVSITIPVFNEEAMLAGSVERLMEALDGSGLSFEVILAENGSSDQTLAVAKGLALRDARIRVLHLERPDYGRAMRAGFLVSSGDCLLNFSIDFVDVGFLRTALSRLASHHVVLGSKYVAAGYDRRPAARRLAGRALSALVRLLFWLPVSDTHGLMALQRVKAAPLLERCRFGHEVFDTELIVRCHRAGLRMCEVPVSVAEQRPSRLGSLRRAMRMLVQLTSLRVALWREGIW